MLCNACGINNSKCDYPEFPPIVTLKNLQEAYQIACFAMYSINSCCECNCLAQNISTSDHNNINILELDLKLISLIEKKDTTVFYFNFYKINNNSDTLLYQTHSNDYTRCMYNGIAVLGKDKRYFPTTLGGHDAIIIDEDFIKDTQQKFNRCLALNNTKISETLKKIIKIENY